MLDLRDEGRPIDAPLLAMRLRQKHGLSEQDASLQVAMLLDGSYRLSNVGGYARRFSRLKKGAPYFAWFPKSNGWLPKGLTPGDMLKAQAGGRQSWHPN